MKITIDIPDHLVEVVSEIFQDMNFYDDYDIAEARHMKDFSLTVEEYVRATHIVNHLINRLSKEATKRRSEC